ncbi:MAG: cytidine deaminase [Eubacterium sp.]
MINKKPDMINQKLIDEAKAALEYAYAPYSEFRVGAAVLTNDNSIFTGCNIENASYGATICAERVAIFKAVSEGYTSLTRIALVSSHKEETFPCGICLQVISEFMPDGIIVTINSDGTINERKVCELLPYSFTI